MKKSTMLRNLCPYSRKMRRYCKLFLLLVISLAVLFYVHKKNSRSDDIDIPKTDEKSIPHPKHENQEYPSGYNDPFRPNPLRNNITGQTMNNHLSGQSIVQKLKPKIQKLVTTITKIDVQNNSIWADQLGVAKNEIEQKFKEDGYNKYAFNTLVSQRLGLSRSLPDTRHKECKNLQYSNELPSASVIICYYHEELNVLLRTIHSVLERTPSNILKEVLVINDQSDIDISQNITSHLGITMKRVLQIHLTKYKNRNKAKIVLTGIKKNLRFY